MLYLLYLIMQNYAFIFVQLYVYTYYIYIYILFHLCVCFYLLVWNLFVYFFIDSFIDRHDPTFFLNLAMGSCASKDQLFDLFLQATGGDDTLEMVKDGIRWDIMGVDWQHLMGKMGENYHEVRLDGSDCANLGCWTWLWLKFGWILFLQIKPDFQPLKVGKVQVLQPKRFIN